MASIEISKPGTFTSMEGVRVPLGADVLQGIAARYDVQLHEAPCVIGHPAHDAPAYGWVKGLSFADGVLSAHADQLDDEFVKLHRKGAFKKVSARFYTPASPNNPTPGHYYLRDIGFLGAMAPAVKGLRTASFADDGAQLVSAELSFADLPAHAGGVIARVLRGLRDWLIAKEGQETADRVLPDWDIESLREIAQRAEIQPVAQLGFSERPDLLDVAGTSTTVTTVSKEPTSMSKTPEQLQADLDAAHAQIASLQQANAARDAAQRHAEHASFADGLIADARWPAGAKDVLVATLDALATPAGDTGCISFGDGDQAKPLHQVLREQLQALPEIVSFGEVAQRRTKADQLSDRDVANRASAYQKRQADQGRHISISQALDAVHAGTDKE